MNILRRFWQDDIPLFKALTKVIGGVAIILGFWIAWFLTVIPFAIINLLLTGEKGGAVPEHAIHVIWRDTLWLLTAGCCVTVPIGIWRSVAKVLALKHTEGIAKLGATVCALAAVIIFAAAGKSAQIMSWRYDTDPNDSYDSLRTSENASARLERNPAFPLTGFWQTSCGNGVGVAIERESRWLKTYRLEDCGLEGCGPHGGGSQSYGSIIGDPTFRVINSNAIEFNALAEPHYRTIYYRCD